MLTLLIFSQMPEAKTKKGSDSAKGLFLFFLVMEVLIWIALANR